jgi:hypothetical protein
MDLRALAAPGFFRFLASGGTAAAGFDLSIQSFFEKIS